MGSHIIPFAGQHHSGAVTQNLLWRDGNIFLMDNHRAALWCWQQEIDLYKEPHRILHIDRHTDCLSASLEQHQKSMPDLRGLSITDYLDAKVQLHLDEAYLFRWDNYLSIHIAQFSDCLMGLISADHNDGDDPKFDGVQRPPSDMLPQNLLYWLGNSGPPWIVNVDLDYFFCAGSNEKELDEGEWISLFSEEYIDAVFKQLRVGIDKQKIKVVTICLTPSYFTPGWQQCLSLSKRIFEILGREHPDI